MRSSYFQNGNWRCTLKTTKVVHEVDETFDFQNGSWLGVLKIKSKHL